MNLTLKVWRQQDNKSAGKFVEYQVQGVTPEYVKGLQAVGLKLTSENLISAKVAGVTPEFVRAAQSHGFKNLDLEKLIELKHAGVLE